MKYFIKTLLLLMTAILAMISFSCGRTQRELADEEIQQAIEQDIVIGKATIDTSQYDYDPTNRSTPPPIGISYQYKVGGEGLVAMHNITSGNFSWTVDRGNGVSQTTHVDGLRPCDAPGTQHIPLKQLGEYGYAVDISLTEEIIQSYTLKAYPVGNYGFDIGTDCAIEDGKLAVLKGKYYYELVIDYIQGRVVYGFFID